MFQFSAAAEAELAQYNHERRHPDLSIGRVRIPASARGTQIRSGLEEAVTTAAFSL